MRPTEMQRRGYAVELASISSNPVLHHHEHPLLDANRLDDALDVQAASWESMWIDVGGEG